MFVILLALALTSGGAMPPEEECFLETECCIWAPSDPPCISSEA